MSPFKCIPVLVKIFIISSLCHFNLVYATLAMVINPIGESWFPSDFYFVHNEYCENLTGHLFISKKKDMNFLPEITNMMLNVFLKSVLERF